MFKMNKVGFIAHEVPTEKVEFNRRRSFVKSKNAMNSIRTVRMFAHKCGWKSTEINYTIKCTSQTQKTTGVGSQLHQPGVEIWGCCCCNVSHMMLCLLLLLLLPLEMNALRFRCRIRWGTCVRVCVCVSARALAPVFIDARLTWTRFCDA